MKLSGTFSLRGIDGEETREYTHNKFTFVKIVFYFSSQALFSEVTVIVLWFVL